MSKRVKYLIKIRIMKRFNEKYQGQQLIPENTISSLDSLVFWNGKHFLCISLLHVNSIAIILLLLSLISQSLAQCLPHSKCSVHVVKKNRIFSCHHMTPELHIYFSCICMCAYNLWYLKDRINLSINDPNQMLYLTLLRNFLLNLCPSKTSKAFGGVHWEDMTADWAGPRKSETPLPPLLSLEYMLCPLFPQLESLYGYSLRE